MPRTPRSLVNIALTNEYSGSSVIQVSNSISGGVPSSLAVLVNSTNFAGAAWGPYTSLPTVTLSSNGWNDIWVGLRGRLQTSQQTWRWRRVKLDQTPPLLVITNPLPGVTFKPMIQLQGYCPEPLASLSFDVSNAAGLFTNQPGFVVHQGYDTNTFEFTTNWFQCFDIGLTNGDNIITLRAVDLAGNVTVTNYTYTFDTSDDTNAPVVQTLWPPAGLRLCGTNFTVRGTLDDETAVVTVSGLTPEPVAGLVERNGKFWVENLPLAAGTNAFTLAATDAAGNSNVLNLTVVQSDVELTIDPVPDDQLYQLTVDVSGVVGDASLVVWVNGVEAEVDGSGNWTAAAVPVNEGGRPVLWPRRIRRTRRRTRRFTAAPG